MVCNIYIHLLRTKPLSHSRTYRKVTAWLKADRLFCGVWKKTSPPTITEKDGEVSKRLDFCILFDAWIQLKPLAISVDHCWIPMKPSWNRSHGPFSECFWPALLYQRISTCINHIHPYIYIYHISTYYVYIINMRIHITTSGYVKRHLWSDLTPNWPGLSAGLWSPAPATGLATCAAGSTQRTALGGAARMLVVVVWGLCII